MSSSSSSSSNNNTKTPTKLKQTASAPIATGKAPQVTVTSSQYPQMSTSGGPPTQPQLIGGTLAKTLNLATTGLNGNGTQLSSSPTDAFKLSASPGIAALISPRGTISGSPTDATATGVGGGDVTILQGVLWKKGVLGNWGRCQCMLSAQGSLKYRRINDDSKDKSSRDWRTASLEECVIKNAEGLTNRPFSFMLFIGNKKTILFAADNEDMKNEWVENIRAHSGHDLGKMRMLHLLEAMHDCVVISDEKGIIIGFNKAAKLMFGFSHSEAIGKNVHILMPQPYKDNHQSYINRHLSTGDTHIIGITRRVLGQRKDGSVFPLELGVGKIITHEGQTRFIATMREITTKSNAETLSMVDSARNVIQKNLSTLTESVEAEFEKLRKRIMDLEHDNSDSASTIEGLKNKVEYHIRWREAAESVLRDKQREEIKEILAKGEGMKEDSNLKPQTDSAAIAREQFQEFQLQTALLIYPHMINELHSWLPGPTKIKKPTLMFSTTMHGANLRTFLARCNVAPNLMLIRTQEDNRVFGGFFTHGWIRSDRYYGDGQCFLFELVPRIKQYKWSPGNPTQFMMVSDSYVVVGGGSKGHALWIDINEQTGMTEACETFDSDPFVNTREPFHIGVLELYGFF